MGGTGRYRFYCESTDLSTPSAHVPILAVSLRSLDGLV